jgi:predicted nucleic acid-binding protein
MTGIKGKTALVKLGLGALIARESGKRFARLGVDVHLITSAVLTGVPVWTLDKKLAQVSDTLNIEY